MTKKNYSTVYLSLEIALESELKTYAGGLGVLAGDILKSAANINFSMVGLSLINSHGYLKQTINRKGEQVISDDISGAITGLKKLKKVISINIENHLVNVGVWRMLIKGRQNFFIPVYFLDTNLASNSPDDRLLTDNLYGGDSIYRLKQEIILGRGGLKMLSELGYKNIKKVHINEAHGAMAAIELYNRIKIGTTKEKIIAVKNQLVFTTHTPLYQDQDVFAKKILLQYQPDFPNEIIILLNKKENLGFVSLAAFLAGKINAVSRLHQRVSQEIFSTYKIMAITNGVNSAFWTCFYFKKIYDLYLPGWRQDPSLLSRASSINSVDIWTAHQNAKKRLLNYIMEKNKERLSADIFTLGFARRFTSYKRPLLLFSDIIKLRQLANCGKGIQIIYAGKAHANDKIGQSLILQLHKYKQILKTEIKIIFLADYNLKIAQLMVAGVDLWLNTPLPPQEASGTSGMKAAHNAVPQISTLDGWWPEGYIKNKTGWLINQEEKINLYRLLSEEIIPLYYNQPLKWRKIMRSTIACNASRFNSDRVLREYIKKMYKN